VLHLGIIDDEKLQAWQIIVNNKNSFQNLDNKIKSIVGIEDFPYKRETTEQEKNLQLEQLKIQFLQLIAQHTRSNKKIEHLLKTGIFTSGKYVSDIKQEDFIKHACYQPDNYELLEGLSEIFLDYQKELELAALPTDRGGKGVEKQEIQKQQELSPWNFVKNMFKEFGLAHTITFPKYLAGDFIKSQVFPFQAKLCIDTDEIVFEKLSSGEKVLCALAITVYQDNKSKFPKLLLLDEIDAYLHPSMIKHLLNVIETVFIKNGCQVILATHSPTTTAIAPESSLFEIQKGMVQEKIKKISKVDAVSLLGEGYVTFEKIITLFDEIFKAKLTLISEGKNIEHIRKALEILDNDLLKEIKLYKHDSGSGDSDLCGLMEFIKNTRIDNKVLFVWDCDASNVVKKQETKNIFKFRFDKNDTNMTCTKGIENLYPTCLFTDDMLTYIVIIQNGHKNDKMEFQEGNKNNFLEKIKKETEDTVFNNFNPLIKKIKAILGK